MLNHFRALIRNERGAHPRLEYGLIASLIALVIIGAVTTIGSSLQNTFQNIGNGL